MKNLIRIENDVFCIGKRLKEIDESYEVYYNLSFHRFEVHSSAQLKGSSYCFSVPFEELDSRTIEYALRTRSDRRDKILEEIEKNNQLLYEKNVKKQVELAKEALC